MRIVMMIMMTMMMMMMMMMIDHHDTEEEKERGDCPRTARSASTASQAKRWGGDSQCIASSFVMPALRHVWNSLVVCSGVARIATSCTLNPFISFLPLGFSLAHR